MESGNGEVNPDLGRPMASIQRVTYVVQPSNHGLPRDTKVSALLDVDTNWWNMELVRNIFNEEEAKEICGMVVCPRNRKDQLVWAGGKNGVFTVRSAYHLAHEIRA
jgi:hypothetical protein